jgi:hypothetical protein
MGGYVSRLMFEFYNSRILKFNGQPVRIIIIIFFFFQLFKNPLIAKKIGMIYIPRRHEQLFSFVHSFKIKIFWDNFIKIY